MTMTYYHFLLPYAVAVVIAIAALVIAIQARSRADKVRREWFEWQSRERRFTIDSRRLTALMHNENKRDAYAEWVNARATQTQQGRQKT